MHVVKARGVEAADRAIGSVVVIDVLRAFTTAAYAFAAGAKEIVLVSEVDEAFALRERFERAVLVGEVGGKPIAGFDHGNSPARMRELDPSGLSGTTVILRSSSGTQGVTRARAADETWLGSLVVASATARALAGSAKTITLIAMGSPYDGDDESSGAEDDACADLIEALLASDDTASMAQRALAGTTSTIERVRASRAARQALDPSIDWITPADLECALAIDRFDFAMRVRREHDLLIARTASIR
jgi:2-phosphosulfolactate phosphatase